MARQTSVDTLGGSITGLELRASNARGFVRDYIHSTNPVYERSALTQTLDELRLMKRELHRAIRIAQAKIAAHKEAHDGAR
jgi:hypothetical protein